MRGFRDSKRLKSYQESKVSSSDQEIFGLRITNHGKNKNIDKIITLDNAEKEEYHQISNQIEKLLNKGGFKDKDKQIAALVAKINDIENDVKQQQSADLKLVENNNDD